MEVCVDGREICCETHSGEYLSISRYEKVVVVVGGSMLMRWSVSGKNKDIYAQ